MIHCNIDTLAEVYITGITILDVGHHEVLDRNCRRIPPCQNRGTRSFSMNLRCICLEPFFGEYCEKFCDQGTRMKGRNSIQF